MDTFGDTFAPTNQDRMKPGQGGASGETGGSVNPIQEAIKTLSYRVPRQTGGQGLAPAALLSGPGSAGVPTSPAGMPGGQNGVQLGLEQLLRMLFGGGLMGGGAPAGGSFAGGASAPTPIITPGIQNPGGGLTVDIPTRTGPPVDAVTPFHRTGALVSDVAAAPAGGRRYDTGA